MSSATSISVSLRTELESGLTGARAAEIFPTHIRPQGVAWALVGTFLSTLIYVEAAPTALANIKWKYYLVFVALTLVNILIVYFWCPEVSSPMLP